MPKLPNANKLSPEAGSGIGVAVETASNEISSSAKSLPSKVAFWFTIEMVAQLLDSEFQVVLNCSQTPGMSDGVKREPIGVELMANCN